jgi:Sulfotransferase family
VSLLERLRGEGDEHAPAPFIVGVNRSGTTLLRLMLDAHPELAIPPETHFVPALIEAVDAGEPTPGQLVEVVKTAREWPDLGFGEDELVALFEAVKPLTAGGALRSLYGAYAEREGKSRWGEKTPGYMTSMPLIEGALPEARFVHVVRDGRDVWLSRTRRQHDPPSPERVAERWQKKIVRARRQAKKVSHYTEIRYEELILDTEGTLRRICDFCELDWDEAMLHYHERAEDRLTEMAHDLPARGRRPHQPAEARMELHALTREPPKAERVQRWKELMSAEDRSSFEAVAGDLLAELGYEVGAVRAGGGDGS